MPAAFGYVGWPSPSAHQGLGGAPSVIVYLHRCNPTSQLSTSHAPTTTKKVTENEKMARLSFERKPVTSSCPLARSPPVALDLRHRRHVVVHGALMISIIPSDGHARPVFLCYGAGIIFIRVPEYAVADFE